MKEMQADGIGYVAGRWPLDPQKSTLIFLHGAGGQGVLWHAQVEALAGRVNTVALDLPGHGRSPGPGMDRIEDYAHAVSAFVHSTGVPGPIPCGLSMGGAITLQLLLDHPARFGAGILASTGAKLRVMPMILETIRTDYGEYIKSFGMFAASEKTDPARIRPLVEAAAACRPEVALGDFQACDSFDVRAWLDRIKVPVLVMTAEEDKLTPTKYGVFLEEKIQGAKREHIMDAGHLAPMERPDEVNQILSSFLDRAGL